MQERQENIYFHSGGILLLQLRKLNTTTLNAHLYGVQYHPSDHLQ